MIGRGGNLIRRVDAEDGIVNFGARAAIETSGVVKRCRRDSTTVVEAGAVCEYAFGVVTMTGGYAVGF